MKICMVLFDPQEFGGLEEYAATLAIGLKQQGQEVSVLSMTWTPPENQYFRRLRENGVTIAQIPKWLSWPASHWPTKERILTVVMWFLLPVTLLLSAGLWLRRRGSWRQAYLSVYGRVSGKIFERFIAENRREPLARMLLNWWRIRWRPDVLHIQGYTSTLLFAIEWAAAKNVPVVYEEHQTPDAQFDWWKGFQQSINKATTVVAVSEESARALRTVCGVTRPIVVRGPLLPDPMASGWKPDAKLPQEEEPIRVSTVARLVVAKGLNYLLETIAQIKLAHPTAQFRVFGDGVLRQELLAYAEQLELDGPAIFVGAFTSRDELSRIMSETDIFVMSSILEGQPLGVVEAMAYGRAIVTTSVGGIPEIIEDGVNGLLCEPKNPTCLAEKIRLLIEDPALRTSLGQAARHSYEKGPFQPVAVSNLFVSIYTEAIRQGRGKSLEQQGVARSLSG
ncbi:MAG TPA: glycosyltransferase family 4 protein [Chloroflexota bacterium]|nr:glycosyltransferase family 4 protein [Chloroflexota bacterium]HUM69778.1 glycosyltransferase family 4 protein [Chloroflexota bacterium]